MSFKVAFIGAGSIGFTRGLLTDLLSVPEFHDIEVAFTDINPDNLRMVTQLCQRDIDENGLNIKIHATPNRREAFKDAKYVINCVRIGMLEAFATDVEIPLNMVSTSAWAIPSALAASCTGSAVFPHCFPSVKISGK